MKMTRSAAVLLAGTVAALGLLGGCGSIKQDAVVATLNKDTEITLGYANFMARYEQATYDYYRGFYGSSDDDYWTGESSSEEGKTMEEVVKADVMDSIEKDYLLDSHRADYQVEVTGEEQKAITEAAKKFLSDNSEEAISQMGATQEYVEKMLYFDTLQHKMQDAIYAEADTNVSDEEAAQKTYSYMQIDLTGEYDDEGQFTEYTEDEVKEIREKAKKAAEAAKKDFEGASKTYGYEISTNSYGKDDVVAEDDDAYNPAIAAADKLKKEKDVSDLIEGKDCYYIIRLDSLFDREATDQKKESIVQERQQEHYTEVTDGYKKDASFDINEKLWKKVKFDSLFTTPLQDESGTEDTGTVEDTGSTDNADTADDAGSTDGADAADDAGSTDGADAAE